MERFYYATKDKDVIDNYRLARHYFIATGKELKMDEIASTEIMDEIAKRFKGLYGRVDNPSWKFLVDHGHKATAVFVYANMYNIGLITARHAVDKYIDNKKDKTNILTDVEESNNVSENFIVDETVSEDLSSNVEETN